MKFVKEVIERRGGIESLRDLGLRLESDGYMPLVIEWVGFGPRDWDMISVAHYYVQNGDVMRDPEMCFEVDEDGKWHPVIYQQDNLGYYDDKVVMMDAKTGKFKIDRKKEKEMMDFAKEWDQNLKDQGFIDQ